MKLNVCKNKKSSMETLNEQIADLQARIQEKDMELETMKSSRNYYKDQCESLLVSLANSVQNHVPAYKTQEEVNEMIESLQAQQKAKRKKIKEKFSQQIIDYETKVNNLNEKVIQQEKMIQDQENERISLIEKLMSYKKSLSEATSIQHETELKLSQLKESESSIKGNSICEEEVVRMKQEHEKEIQSYEFQAKKLKKKIKYLLNSLEITQSAQNESTSDISTLNKELKKQKEIELQLRNELAKEKQNQVDATALLKIAATEAQQMQNDSIEASKRIAALLGTIKEQEETMVEMQQSLWAALKEGKDTKEQLQNQNKDIVDIHMKIQEINLQHSAEIDKYKEEQSKSEQTIAELNDTIRHLKNAISELESDRKELQNELNQKMLEINQENRMRKAAELAKETALTNLKNAYSLMNSNESARHETNLEIEKLTTELENKSRQNSELTKTVSDLENRLDVAQLQLKSEQTKSQQMSSEFSKVSSELQKFRENSVTKSEMKDQLDSFRKEKAAYISQIKELQQQYNMQLSENETKEITLKHQEEVLKKSLYELKNLQRQNKALRKKLQLNDFSVSGKDDENDDTNSILNLNNEKMQNEYRLLKSKNQHMLNDLSTKETIVKNAREEIRTFVAKLAEIAISEEISPRFMELRSKLDKDTLTIYQEIVELNSFISDFIDDLISHIRDNGSAMSGPNATEVKLLKSTISHLQNKVSALKVQTQLQNEEISTLREKFDIVTSKKEQAEAKMSAMNESMGSFRQSLATQKKIKIQSQIKPSNTSKIGDNDVSKTINESQIDDSDTDISDISSGSNHELNHSAFSNRKANKVTTLSDSLALLDLLCQ